MMATYLVRLLLPLSVLWCHSFKMAVQFNGFSTQWKGSASSLSLLQTQLFSSPPCISSWDHVLLLLGWTFTILPKMACSLDWFSGKYLQHMFVLLSCFQVLFVISLHQHHTNIKVNYCLILIFFFWVLSLPPPDQTFPASSLLSFWWKLHWTGY